MRNLIGLAFVLLPTVLLAQAPPPPRFEPRVQLNGKTTFFNGPIRRITVTQNDESIAIEDTAGKNITVRRTRMVNGEKKSELFQAPDLETLKKNHPEAAELYRTHTAGELTAEQNRARLEAQLQARQAGGFFGPGTFATRPGQGSRQLTSTARGKTVEIEDQYGEHIKVRITEKKSGEPKVREVEAKNPSELRERDAEAADHYKRLTGDN